MVKRTDKDALVAIVEKALNLSVSFVDSKLARERREVLEYYRGERPLPIHSGSSKYVSMDVYEAVDSMRAQLLETFSAHQQIVQFTPQGAEDVEPARIATEYCSFVVFRQNDGESIMYSTLSDGLMARYGVVQVYPETETGEEEEYHGLSPEEVEALTMEDGVVVNKQEDLTDEEGNTVAHNLYLSRPKTKICLSSIPPEDFLISANADSVQGATYTIYRTKKSKDDLIEMGYDENVVNGLQNDDDLLDLEKSERFEPVQGLYVPNSDLVVDDDKLFWVYVAHVRTTIDGEYRLWKIVMAARTILEVTEAKRRPFEAFVALPVPHTWFGENYAKQVIPIQRARTTLFRSILDHAMVTNNPRLQVVNGAVPNPSELMDNRIGGIVNVRRTDGIIPIPQAPLNPYVFQTIQLLDEDKEENTGISRLSQGLNKDAISKQNAQGLVEQLINVSQIRQKVIARQFGKFLKNLYLLIYDTALEYIDHQTIADVAGNWIDIDPSSWEARKDARVELSLGYGEAQQEANKYINLNTAFSQDPQLGNQYGPQQKYEVIKRATRKMGIVDLEALLLPPDKAPPAQPDPMQQAELAIKQANAEMLSAQAKATVMKAQADLLRAQTEAKAKDIDSNVKVANEHLKDQEFEHKRTMDIWEAGRADEVADADKKAIFAVNGNA